MKFGAGFGLLSLLVTFAIIFFVMFGKGGCFPGYFGAVARVKKEKEPVVQQWGGKDVRGRPFGESLDLERWPASGEVKGLEVTRVDPMGPAFTYFGLQVGDVITHIGPLDVGGPLSIDTPAAGTDFLTDAYAKQFPITVRRGAETLTLPLAPPAPGGAAGAAPGSRQQNTGTRLPNLPQGLPTGP